MTGLHSSNFMKFEALVGIISDGDQKCREIHRHRTKIIAGELNLFHSLRPPAKGPYFKNNFIRAHLADEN